MNGSDILVCIFDDMNPTKGVVHPRRAWPVQTPGTAHALPHVGMLVYLKLQCLTVSWDNLTDRLELVKSDLCLGSPRQSNTYWVGYG